MHVVRVERFSIPRPTRVREHPAPLPPRDGRVSRCHFFPQCEHVFHSCSFLVLVGLPSIPHQHRTQSAWELHVNRCLLIDEVVLSVGTLHTVDTTHKYATISLKRVVCAQTCTSGMSSRKRWGTKRAPTRIEDSASRNAAGERRHKREIIYKETKCSAGLCIATFGCSTQHGCAAAGNDRRFCPISQRQRRRALPARPGAFGPERPTAQPLRS